MSRGIRPGSGELGWCYVCVICESGFSVYMAGPDISSSICRLEILCCNMFKSLQSVYTIWGGSLQNPQNVAQNEMVVILDSNLISLNKLH